MMRPTNEVPHHLVSINDIAVDDEKGGSKKDIQILAEEIEEKEGLHYPIIITNNHMASPKEPPYLIRRGWGLKRLEAAHVLGWKTVPAVIVPPFLDKNQPDKIVEKFVDIIERCQRKQMTDFDLGKAACEMERLHNIKPKEFGDVIGLSVGYSYNLNRWYRNNTPEIRKAWEEHHEYLNQTLLDTLSKMTPKEALQHWRKQIDARSNPRPYSPDNKRDERSADRQEKKPKRASVTDLANLAIAIEESPLKDPVKNICSQVVKYALGLTRTVPGITNGKPLHSYVIDKSAAP
jgi:hypothetical protein